MAGAILITDGVVADVPANAAALGFTAPVHSFITGEEGERDRRIVLNRAPRFAILDEPQSLDFRVVDSELPTVRRHRAPEDRRRRGDSDRVAVART
jgi:hypothetical protein